MRDIYYKPLLETKTPSQMTAKQNALANCRKKFEKLNESERLLEANKFINHVCSKGGSVNMALAFLKEAGVMDDTELMHSVTF